RKSVVDQVRWLWRSGSAGNVTTGGPKTSPPCSSVVVARSVNEWRRYPILFSPDFIGWQVVTRIAGRAPSSSWILPLRPPSLVSAFPPRAQGRLSLTDCRRHPG